MLRYICYVICFRIFSHPNVLPVLGAVNESGSLVILSQYMPYGSLYNVLHEGTGKLTFTTRNFIIYMCPIFLEKHYLMFVMQKILRFHKGSTENKRM